MGTSAAVGYSAHKNPVEAGKEAASKALAKAGISKPDFVFAFATVGYHQQSLLDSIREVTSGAPLCGCSCEGVIAQETVDESNFAVCVMVICSDELRFHNTSVREMGRHMVSAGAKLAGDINPHLSTDSLACFVMADGMTSNFEPFLASFEAALAPDARLPVFGGLAADNWAFRKTYQYHDGEVFSGGVSCVLMSGKGDIAWGVNHGCVQVGTKRTITRCEGNNIYEIDGIPVLDVIKEYLDEDWISQWNKVSLNLCFGFKTPERIGKGDGEFVIRHMTGICEQQGYVTIQSDVTNGTELWIVCRDKELITSSLPSISRRIKEKACGRKPKFILHFECVGRGKAIFREKEKLELIRSLQSDLGPEVPWIGFYGLGEIGPIENCNCFHNFTSVITAVY
jgi:hypothetical protein